MLAALVIERVVWKLSIVFESPHAQVIMPMLVIPLLAAFAYLQFRTPQRFEDVVSLLRRSPWQAKHPLPFANGLPSREGGLVLLVAIGFLCSWGITGGPLAKGFACFGGAAATAAALSGRWPLHYADDLPPKTLLLAVITSAFIVSFFLRPSDVLLAFLIVLLILLAGSVLLQRRLLQRFEATISQLRTPAPPEHRATRLGWPWDQLNPAETPEHERAFVFFFYVTILAVILLFHAAACRMAALEGTSVANGLATVTLLIDGLFLLYPLFFLSISKTSRGDASGSAWWQVMQPFVVATVSHVLVAVLASYQPHRPMLIFTAGVVAAAVTFWAAMAAPTKTELRLAGPFNLRCEEAVKQPKERRR